MAEIKLYGWIVYSQDVNLNTGRSCTAKVSVNGAYPVNAYKAVTYNLADTAIVREVAPKYGPSNGGTTITINGERFKNTAQVLIDGVPCDIKSLTATRITCVSGDRDISNTRTPDNEFDVLINGNKAAVESTFIYANKFSEEATWGGDIPPREMDSFAVPLGETLIMDMTPPKLFAIIVEG